MCDFHDVPLQLRDDGNRRHHAEQWNVVDDVRDSADSLSRLLMLDGHDVHTAYDGSQALAEAAAFQPDVILLDLGLPDKNGFEVAAEFRADRSFRDVMLVAFAVAAVLLQREGGPADREALLWGGGHVLQFVNAILLISNWRLLAQGALGGFG